MGRFCLNLTQTVGSPVGEDLNPRDRTTHGTPLSEGPHYSGHTLIWGFDCTGETMHEVAGRLPGVLDTVLVHLDGVLLR